jgi:hypothetical protein
MKKQIFPILLVLIITGMVSVSAMAQVSTHSIWTFDGGGRQLNDPELPCEYARFEKFHLITSWTEPTPGYAAQAHLRGVALTLEDDPCGAHFYEFTLLQSTSTTSTTITGNWDIYRDGVLKCGNCTGHTSGFNQAVTNYYKIVIDDPVIGPGTWFFSGFIDARDDF